MVTAVSRLNPKGLRVYNQAGVTALFIIRPPPAARYFIPPYYNHSVNNEMQQCRHTEHADSFLRRQ
jgi:hypothetical protein